MPGFGDAPGAPGQNAGQAPLVGQSMVLNARDLANHGNVIGRGNTGRVPANVIEMLKNDNNSPQGQVPDNVGILAADGTAVVGQDTLQLPPPPRFMPSGL